MRGRQICCLGPSRANGSRAGGRWGAGRCPKQLDVASSHVCDRMCIGNGSRDAGRRLAMTVAFPLVVVRRSRGRSSLHFAACSTDPAMTKHHDWIWAGSRKRWYEFRVVQGC